MIRLLTALAASMLCPALVHAAPGDATRLEYARSERAARCPDRESLKNAVTKRLGYDPFFPVARQTIVVEITDADDGLRAQMHLIDENGMIVGSRELKDKPEHCDELVSSLALAISIALDPSAALGVEPSRTTESPAPAASSASDRDAPATASEPIVESIQQPKGSSAQPSGKKSAVELVAGRIAFPSTLRAASFSTLGVAPSLAFGLRAGIGFRWRWFQLLAEFADQFPATHDTNRIGSAQASLYEGTLAPCFVRGSLASCGVFNLGSVQAEGRGVEYPEKQHSLYAALGARVEFTPQLAGPIHLLLATGVLKPLTPITLLLNGEEVWKTPLISGELTLGLAWQFP